MFLRKEKKMTTTALFIFIIIILLKSTNTASFPIFSSLSLSFTSLSLTSTTTSITKHHPPCSCDEGSRRRRRIIIAQRRRFPTTSIIFATSSQEEEKDDEDEDDDSLRWDDYSDDEKNDGRENNKGDIINNNKNQITITTESDYDDDGGVGGRGWFQPAVELWTERMLFAIENSPNNQPIYFEERFAIEIKRDTYHKYRPNNFPSTKVYIKQITNALRRNPQIYWKKTLRGITYQLHHHQHQAAALKIDDDDNDDDVSSTVFAPTTDRRHPKKSLFSQIYRCSKLVTSNRFIRLQIIIKLLYKRFWNWISSRIHGGESSNNFLHRFRDDDDDANDVPTTDISSIAYRKQQQRMQRMRRRQLGIGGLIRLQKNNLRKRLRFVRDRHTIYVLECENNKYYVGTTVNRRRRIKEHMSSQGSSWTRLHKPVKVIKEYRRVPSKYYLGFEAQITAQLMFEKGVNNVRGAMFTHTRQYTKQESDFKSLIGFLGHYNDIPYSQARAFLKATLPSSISWRGSNDTGNNRSTSYSRGNNGGRNDNPRFYPPSHYTTIRKNRDESTSTAASSSSSSILPPLSRRLQVQQQQQQQRQSTKRRNSNGMQRKCYNCGEYGHYASDCPRPNSVNRRQCRICGEYGHYAADCPNKDEEIVPLNRRRCFKCGKHGHYAADCPEA